MSNYASIGSFLLIFSWKKILVYSFFYLNNIHLFIKATAPVYKTA